MDEKTHIVTAVMERISNARRNQARVRVALFGCFLVAAFGSFVPTFKYLSAAVARSGFVEYASLLAHGGIPILRYWKEFALSLVDSAPITEFAILTAVVLIFVYSARSLTLSLSSLSKFNRYQNLIA